MGEQVQIPITKAGKGVGFPVDVTDLQNTLSAEDYAMVFQEGLKVLLNSRMSKLPATKDLQGSELAAATAKALEKAEENLRMLRAGELRKKAGGTTAAAAGVTKVVMTEATRLAKEVIKSTIKKAGQKISLYTAAQITAAAKAEVANNPKYLADAAIAVAEREKIPTLDGIMANLTPDPKLVKKAAEAKAEAARNKPLSATQSGKTKKRAGGAKPVPSRGPRAEPFVNNPSLIPLS